MKFRTPVLLAAIGAIFLADAVLPSLTYAQRRGPARVRSVPRHAVVASGFYYRPYYYSPF